MSSLLRSRIIQPKLTVSHPDDEYEREADRVADQVMRMADGESVGRLQIARSSTLQRKCGCNGGGGKPCECGEGPATVQRHVDSTPEVPSVPESVPLVLRSAGRPLDGATRNFMETRFGHDFSGVRVHLDGDAAASARSINAHAYTVGNHVVFGPNQFQPATDAGRRLLAHELTHVIQQDSSGRIDTAGTAQLVQRAPMPRDEEVRLSFTSPGEIEILSTPPMLSLYNFAIWESRLKEKHVLAINLLGAVIQQFAAGTLSLAVKGHADNTGEDPINNPLSRERSVAVQKALSSAAGVPVTPSSCGKHCPIASNASVEGRSRNRRVDISFTAKKGGDDMDWPSLCKLYPEVCLCLMDPSSCRRKDDDGDGDGIEWPTLCPGILGKAICLGIVCLLAAKFCLTALCRLFPELCLWALCKIFPSRCKGKREPPKDEPKRKRACQIKVDLPSGKKKALKEEEEGFVRLYYPFKMNIDFKNDSSGCDCSCGEYEQRVMGYRDYDDTGKGPWHRERGAPLAPGVYLLDNKFQEDGHIASGPYGHRYWDDETRTDPKPNQQGDLFLKTREHGCLYRGEDEPEFAYNQDYPARIKMHLEFVGGPVDVCMTPGQRTPLNSHWHSWVIDGEAQAKPPTPPKRRTLTDIPFIVRWGLPIYPQLGQEVVLGIVILNESDECRGRIEISIVAIDQVTITAMTRNSKPVQLAPDACPDIWILPYQNVTIYR